MTSRALHPDGIAGMPNRRHQCPGVCERWKVFHGSPRLDNHDGSLIAQPTHITSSRRRILSCLEQPPLPRCLPRQRASRL